MTAAIDLNTIPTAAPLSPSVDLVEASYRSEAFPQHHTREQREANLTRYLLWLNLKLRNPTVRLAPTRAIDDFWHLHMLSPVAYHRDCMRWFGRILDHDGGFGRRSEEVPMLRETFAQTAKLYEQTYGLPYRDDGVSAEDTATNCWHDCSGRCWHACSEVR